MAGASRQLADAGSGQEIVSLHRQSIGLFALSAPYLYGVRPGVNSPNLREQILESARFVAAAPKTLTTTHASI
jgi:hypothetical protein